MTNNAKSPPSLPLLLALAWCCVFTASDSACGQTWIVTNTIPRPKLTSDYLGEIDLTPSVTTNVVNGPSASLFESSGARLLVRAREPLLVRVTASGRTGGRIMADYDVRADVGGIPENASTLEQYEISKENPRLMKVNYFRGRVFFTASRVLSDEWITVFGSEDRRHLVAVHDGGAILVSGNTGSTWSRMPNGNYEFTLATTRHGSVLVAAVSHADKRTTIAAAPQVSQMNTQNWYAAVSAADGSQLVISGGPSQSAPALSIRTTNGNVIVAWPASYTGLILQRNSDLSTTNWINVTKPLEVNDMENYVIFPTLNSRDFFRLTKE